MVHNPSKVKNKVKRTSLYTKYKAEKKKAKKQLKVDRVKESEALGEELPKRIPRTIENTRIDDANRILPNDQEVLGDEADDEFASIFSSETVRLLLFYMIVRSYYLYIDELMYNVFRNPRL
jgi:ribosome production factor 1